MHAHVRAERGQAPAPLAFLFFVKKTQGWQAEQSGGGL